MLVFFDDILVYNRDWRAHLHHLEVVLKILKQEQLFAKFSKCSFGNTEVDYLGHTISPLGMAMDKEKVSAVLEWPCLLSNN